MRWTPALLTLLLACNRTPEQVEPTQPPEPSVPSATLAFEDVRIFDGERFVERTTVIIDGETIVAVGPDLVVPEGTPSVPTDGMTLLPGLIDAHAHVQAPEQLARALVFGVTTEIDMFTTPELAARLRKPANDRAELVSAGILATAPGGHGTEYGMAIPTLTGPEQAEAFVAARVEEGSDFIKIVYDDGHGFGGSMPTIDAATLKALIDAAHAKDRLAVVHVSSQDEAIEAIEAGADGLAHLFLEESSGEFLRLATDHGIFVTDTLPVLGSICSGGKAGKGLAEDESLRPLMLPVEVGALQRSFPALGVDHACGHSVTTAKLLHHKGVRLLASTDAPNPGTTHGASMHQELAFLVTAGLSAEEALRAATSAPAEVFGLDDRGRIAKGKQADLLLVGGHPDDDIRVTRHIRGVWKRGMFVDHEVLREQAAERWAEIDRAKNAPPPAGLAAGLVSDFESGEPRSEFGAGWMGSTDAMRGGASVVQLEVVEDGDEGSLPNAWAGAMFFPGDQPMGPANLVDKPTLVFQARGDGPMMVLIFAKQLGMVPAMTTVAIGEEWAQHELDLRTLLPEPYDVNAIFFGGPPRAGEFTIFLDDVRLK